MQFCLNKRTYIRALSQHSHKKRKDFLLILLNMVSRIISQIERNQHWIADYPIECCLNSLTYINRFSFFNWIGSSRNNFFLLDFNLKVFVPFFSLKKKNTEYNVWNQHWKLTMLHNVVQMDWFTLKQITFYI